jgi:acyl carrier protein
MALSKGRQKIVIIYGRMSLMVLEKVKVILSNQFDVEEDSITAETNIADDLGADSLDVVDMLMSLEDEFDIEIPDDEIERIRTVGDIVTYIEENM